MEYLLIEMITIKMIVVIKLRISYGLHFFQSSNIRKEATSGQPKANSVFNNIARTKGLDF